MAERLKAPRDGGRERDEQVRRDVSEMLLRIERGGEPVIRELSRRLDRWDPPDFVVGPETIAAATRAVPEALAGHIEFALGQVRGFARHQRETLTDLRVEVLPGVVLGHRHVPVESSGAYVPGGRYPMLASSFMTIAGCGPPLNGGAQALMRCTRATLAVTIDMCADATIG